MFKTTLKKKSVINIIPMIDVIFFILVFFMLFTTFRSNISGIDLQLPKAVTVSQQKQENLVIDVAQSGEVYYNGKATSLSSLIEIAGDKFKNNKDIVAIINADRDVKYSYIISVMDSMRQAGIYKLALAAEKRE